MCVCVLSLLSLRLPDIPPISVITECQARLPVLYSGFPLGNVLHMIVRNICQCSFFNLSYPLLPPLCLPVLPVHLHLLFFSVNRIISTMFLDSIGAQISFQKCILSALVWTKGNVSMCCVVWIENSQKKNRTMIPVLRT